MSTLKKRNYKLVFIGVVFGYSVATLVSNFQRKEELAQYQAIQRASVEALKACKN